jgi:hypothetical protein
MKKYIGTRQLEAEPMTLGGFVQKQVETPMVRTLRTMKKQSKVIMLNVKMVTKVGCLPNRLRNIISVQIPFLTVCTLR